MMKALDVLSPEYRGAPFPAFDPAYINTSELPDNMRPKEWDIAADGDTCEIEWLTQEPWTRANLKQFIAAIKQAFKRNGCTGTIKLHIDDRNGQSPATTRIIHIKED